MKNRNSSARTKAEKSTKAEVTTSSQTIAKPNVSCSHSCPTTQELFPISERQDLSKIDCRFLTHNTGTDNEFKSPFVPLYNYMRCVEMLQAAEYQIKFLTKALSKQQPKTQ